MMGSLVELVAVQKSEIGLLTNFYYLQQKLIASVGRSCLDDWSAVWYRFSGFAMFASKGRLLATSLTSERVLPLKNEGNSLLNFYCLFMEMQKIMK